LGQRVNNGNDTFGKYSWLSYAQVGEARTAIGSGLLHYGIQPASHIGIYSVNCVEWSITDHACHAYSMIPVPLYDTLGPDSVQYICAHAEVSAVFCASKVLDNLLSSIQELKKIRLVVVYGSDKNKPLPSVGAGASFDLVRFEDLIKVGQANPKSHVPPRPSQLCKICYTSGTTGVPKGVMVTHSNMIANIAGAAVVPVKEGDIHISYLPMAHIYEHTLFNFLTHHGVSVGFFSGDVLNLLDDIAELKPTVFVSVPRLWNKIYDKINAGINESGIVTRSLFNAAFASKSKALEQGDQTGGKWGKFWDYLIFSKLRAKLGGNVQFMVSGASPISAEVMRFLRVCFANVVEGYGLSEVGIVTVSGFDDPSLGHVGPPLACVEIKLEDIPDMNYFHSDEPYPRGEICIRGPTVFEGYYNDEAKTREVVDDDGWFHTGDVGCWIPGGKLKIIDRKKNLFKLAQGEYVAPEKIEQICERSPFVGQIFVYGDSLKDALVAVVSPDPDYIVQWAKERGLPQDVGTLCQDSGVLMSVLRSVQEQGRSAKLRGFEQVKAIYLHPEPFTIEAGLLTPTMKIKRPQLKAMFENAIAAMYAALDK
jgi:long-chain acyl-CoA synthetase